MKLLKMSDLVEITGLGRSTIYKEISTGRFPKPIKIAERTAVWTESDVTHWINSKIKRHNDAEREKRDYVIQLGDKPSSDEICKFIDDIMGSFIEAAEDEMKTIRQRLFQERAKILEETVNFLYEGSNISKREK